MIVGQMVIFASVAYKPFSRSILTFHIMVFFSHLPWQATIWQLLSRCWAKPCGDSDETSTASSLEELTAEADPASVPYFWEHFGTPRSSGQEEEKGQWIEYSTMVTAQGPRILFHPDFFKERAPGTGKAGTTGSQTNKDRNNVVKMLPGQGKVQIVRFPKIG